MKLTPTIEKIIEKNTELFENLLRDEDPVRYEVTTRDFTATELAARMEDDYTGYLATTSWYARQCIFVVSMMESLPASDHEVLKVADSEAGRKYRAVMDAKPIIAEILALFDQAINEDIDETMQEVSGD